MGRLVSETAMPGPDFQHNAIATSARAQAPRSTRQEALPEKHGLMTPDAAEDDMSLPAYGDLYDENRSERGASGTSASITDDGRVDIRINQFNHHLAQIFTPSLRQQIQESQDSQPPPPPYIPPFLKSEEGAPLPPSLSVVIQVVGSRGDVQPFLALGKVLKETYGHRLRLATHPIFREFVEDSGLEFFSIGSDPSRLMAFMVKNPGLMPGVRSLLNGDVGQRREDVAEYIQGCWRSCFEAGDGLDSDIVDDDPSLPFENDSGSRPAAKPFVADCIIANPPSFAHIHCAEKLGIPLHIMFTMPYTPTQAFPHPLANIQSSNADPQMTNYMSYAMIEALSWQGLGDLINRFREKCLGLDPISRIWGPGTLQRLKVPHTYCWSPALIPKPKDWGAQVSIAGFYFLNLASAFTPTPALQAFLDAGPPPVYIGFGSIVLDDPDAMTDLVFEAVKKTGQRVLLAKGWGGMGGDQLRVPESVFILGNVPHDWLFQRVSCVVHHGGAGTTAAGIAAGRPTLVIPFFGDQPFWGAMVARAGAGPDPIPYRHLTAEKLADAVAFCLRPESQERAKELAGKISTERGSDTGAQLFHQYLEADRLRCVLAPSRAAAWRIKHTKVRLSAFAACTLANAKLLDFHDLKLFRPEEYYIDEGPVDPVSGGFTAMCGSLGNMAMGIFDLPSETVKALRNPFAASRQQSRASTPTAMRSRTSLVGQRSTSSTSPTASQTSLGVQESRARGRSSSDASAASSHRSNIASSSKSDGNQSRGHGRNSKNRDLLRQTKVDPDKGLGRLTKAALLAPMQMSVNFTKGFHNMPKLWGDETVRPQERISDFKSGTKAIGREFGFGMYDGITGLVTQPWKGAQKEGASGFAKGIGKGIGGFIVKPGAALFSLPSYFMKGAHKEMQKFFRSNVQNYIVASRAAQGYEEWQQSSESEKQEVIAQWKLIQKVLKTKRNPDEMVQDHLEAQRMMETQSGNAHPGRAHTMNSTEAAGGTGAPVQDPETNMLAMGGSRSNSRSTTAPVILESGHLPQLQQREDAEHDASEQDLRQAMAASEAEAQQLAKEALDHDEQLRRAMAQSLLETRQRSSDSELESETMSLNDEEDAEMDRAREFPEKMAAEAAVGGSSISQRPPSYDPGHLGGTTRREFEAQQRGEHGEKTAQERSEEEIVLEYIKKQSLLEAYHHKGKSRAAADADEDDEDLQRTLKMSMQGYQSGEASRA